MTELTILHGESGRPDLELCREAAPSYTHGVMKTTSLTNMDVDWALDNGAFVCWKKDRDWLWSGRAEEFIGMVERIPEKPRKPMFVILPDIVNEPEATFRRSTKFLNIIRYELEIGIPLYLAAQSGMSVNGILSFVDRWNLDGVFVGGSKEFKRSITPELVSKSSVPIHVGRPDDLLWADSIGVDSVDTTSIIRNNSWHRLELLEQQQSFTEVEQQCLTE